MYSTVNKVSAPFKRANFTVMAKSCNGRSTTSKILKDTVEVVKSEDRHKECVVRLLRQEDIPKLMENRRKRGLHLPYSSVQTWYTVDPEGIRIILESESGEIIGSCSVIKQSDDFYFGGMYVIEEGYRGLGIGMQVWKACVPHVGDANAGLNALPENMELFRDRGSFPIVETKFECIFYSTTKPIDPNVLSNHLPQGVTIEPFQRSHLPHILAYDFALVGFKRELALELSCQELDSRTLVAFKDGRCIGFGSIKTGCLGAGRVGPLYADDPVVAEAMLRRLIVSMPGLIGLAMGTVSTNTLANLLMERLGVEKIYLITRLYRKETLNVNTSQIFAFFDLTFTPF